MGKREILINIALSPLQKIVKLFMRNKLVINACIITKEERSKSTPLLLEFQNKLKLIYDCDKKYTA